MRYSIEIVLTTLNSIKLKVNTKYLQPLIIYIWSRQMEFAENIPCI